MLLTELKGRRPTRAGKARIEYASRDTYPERRGDTIVLPSCGDLELYRLQPGWNQFIVRQGYNTTWFGGTDENPFLVHISDTPYRAYCKGGPEGFYRSLVPDLPGPAYRRQGDIFASSIPFSWEEVLRALKLILGWNSEVVESCPDERGGGLFGTRHHLKGVQLRSSVRLPVEGSGRTDTFFILAEGTVVAPDHTDMKLEGVYALAQTRHLQDPRIAD